MERGFLGFDLGTGYAGQASGECARHLSRFFFNLQAQSRGAGGVFSRFSRCKKYLFMQFKFLGTIDCR